MSDKNDAVIKGSQGTSRRRVLEMMGGLAVAVPVVGLGGCGGGDEPAQSAQSLAPAAPSAADSAAGEMESAAESMTKSVEESVEVVEEKIEMAGDKAGEMAADAEQMAEEVVDEAKTIASDGMARVDENGPQAMGLGYRHDASTVNTASQPRYAAGQQCSNCVLFQGGDADWGGCALFAGQQVKGTGWCSAYTAKG